MTRCELHGHDEDHCPDCARPHPVPEATVPAVSPAAESYREIGRRHAARIRARLADRDKPAPPEGDTAA